MFDYDGPKVELRGGGCKRDLNAEAERLNKRLIANREMLSVTKNFIKFGDFREINRDSQQQFYSLLGALDIRIEEQTQGLDLLLAQIEKEGKDSSGA